MPGWHSKTLVEQLGYKLPIEAERGYHLMTKPASTPSLPVASYERKMIMTPMQEGLRLAGTVEFAGTALADNWQRAERLRLHGDALWPALADHDFNSVVACSANHAATSASTDAGAQVVAPDNATGKPPYCWSGMRPTLPDSLPVIQWL